ncbi:rop guanine nucleotide exchange factor-like protein [Actinidia rufa]|uniref:Rop guanine nucleotide exchange factor-like protein n=1 Tax=Actinidia rufa TaxID=165716 RepID=A0A7J0FZQ0_9ERIC|nr:rop guanine nucleotide exchange factor-like protein [Actinidia rufa]
MVRALEEEQAHFKSRLFHFRGMHENTGRKAQSEILESSGPLSPMELDRVTSRSQASKPVSNEPVVGSKIGLALNRNNEKSQKAQLANDEGLDSSLTKDKHPSGKPKNERFAKLLLGEDMSGGGKGVSSALALSNAITNLAASVFGEQKRLEPMAPERRARWRKEIDWLLSVTDHIVEMVPSKQISKDGTNMEDCQDNFKDQNEFSYVSKDEESEKGKTKRKDDKWWIPMPKVPPNGLSEVTKKWLQFQKDSVNQVLKAAMAINAQVLSEMVIPENYIDSLPKNGRASLGDSIYKSITGVDYFDPDHFLSTMDLSSEHKILDLKNRIEASVVIWKRKMNAKDGKSSWSSAVSLEKREQFEDRAETVLLIIKQRFPGLPQSALDISKIQYNQDVGQAVLESYSRILESLAYTVISRIEDVLHADSLAQNPSLGEQKRNPLSDSSLTADKFPNAREELEKLNLSETPASMTLSDFMGWTLDQGDAEMKKDSVNEWFKDNDAKPLSKTPNIVTNKKFSYIENLGGLRSPIARH